MSNIKEWTVMIYFASDNPLAPIIVSQLKAIKDAGFHPDVNVIARFDPHTEDKSAHIFEVNLVNKLKNPGRHQVGFRGSDPYVRNVVLDRLWGKDDEKIKDFIRESLVRSRNGGKSVKTYDPPSPSEEMFQEQTPGESLCNFLNFCRDNYKARHYMLLILGHGVVVGNDLFLYDENTSPPPEDEFARCQPPAQTEPGDRQSDSRDENTPPASLRLRELGEILRSFKDSIGPKSEFDLIGFHSCSMSGLEVAFELKGTADHMMASQGPAFVNAWPYRQLLIRLFNDLIQSKKNKDGKLDVKKMLRNMLKYCLYNSYDFQLAGYSCDLTLCDLSKVSDEDSSVAEPIRKLSEVLTEGVSNEFTRKLILLAHWEAQSYWQESYTDLYDFCLKLKMSCESVRSISSDDLLGRIIDACNEVVKVLESGDEPIGDTGADGNRVVMLSAFTGPAYQYSHGLSVFFPWSKPSGDFFPDEYREYEFKKRTSWDVFLENYFKETQRKTRKREDEEVPDRTARTRTSTESRLLEFLEEVTTKSFNSYGELSNGRVDPRHDPRKGGPTHPLGDGCHCPSIKNHPSVTRAKADKRTNLVEDRMILISMILKGLFKI